MPSPWPIDHEPFEAYFSSRWVDIIWRCRQQLLHACEDCIRSLRKTFTELTLPQAINEMVRQLRAGTGTTGLILANGGMVTYQHAVCVSRIPRRDGTVYPQNNPLPEKITDVSVPVIVFEASGDALIEVMSSRHCRAGDPLTSHRLALSNFTAMGRHSAGTLSVDSRQVGSVSSRITVMKGHCEHFAARLLSQLVAGVAF